MSVPAENIRTATRARIKRASTRAQRRMNRLDERALEALERMYREARQHIEERIRAAARDGALVQLQDMRLLRSQVDQQIDQLAAVRNAFLVEQLQEAARLGVDPFAGVEISGDLVEIADQAARFVQEFLAEDGLTLSDRLWRVDAGAKDALGRMIERAVVEGYSASQAAQEYLFRGAAVPADIQARMGAANAHALAKRAGRAFFEEDASAYARARRVFRTELNRAHGTAYMEAGFRVSGVIGTRFLLSPAHPRRDICDMHAKVNRYGLGPGVYPKDRNPWPAHPNTLSYVVVVFDDEVSAADRAGKVDRISWLKQQSAETKAAVLGSGGKVSALDRGVLKEDEIGTPWNVLKKRYEKRGINVEELEG